MTRLSKFFALILVLSLSALWPMGIAIAQEAVAAPDETNDLRPIDWCPGNPEDCFKCGFTIDLENPNQSTAWCQQVPTGRNQCQVTYTPLLSCSTSGAFCDTIVVHG